MFSIREETRKVMLQGGQTTPLVSHLADLAATKSKDTTSCFPSVLVHCTRQSGVLFSFSIPSLFLSLFIFDLSC
jgi:hypothetical protein